MAAENARRDKVIQTWGEATNSRVAEILTVLTRYAALEAIQKFDVENIYGFFLYTDSAATMISGARVFTRDWLDSETYEDRWSPLYVEEYMIGEWDMESLSRFAARNTEAVLPSCMAALKTLVQQQVLPEEVVVNALSGAEGDEESLLRAESINTPAVIEIYKSLLTINEADLQAFRETRGQQ